MKIRHINASEMLLIGSVLSFGIGCAQEKNKPVAVADPNVQLISSRESSNSVDDDANFLEKKYGIDDDLIVYALEYQDISRDKYKSLEKYINFKDINPVRDANNPLLNALLYDVVAVGEITDAKTDPSRASCYHTIYDVQIKKYSKACKAVLRKNKIKIVEVSGPLSGGHYLESMGGDQLKKGVEYLFVLSNSKLRYFEEQHKSNPEECDPKYATDVFLASRFSIPTETKDRAWEKRLEQMKPVLKILCPELNP